MKGIRSQHAEKEQESLEGNSTPNIPRGKGPELCTLPLLTRELQVQAGWNHTLCLAEGWLGCQEHLAQHRTQDRHSQGNKDGPSREEEVHMQGGACGEPG